MRESVVQTTAAVKQAYWTLKATLANVTVQQRSLELAQELVRQNKARVDIGQTPPLDLLQAEAEVAQRRENLIRANTAVGDAEDRLRRLIMDPADVYVLADAHQSHRRARDRACMPDVDAVVADAFAGRYDLARARKDLENIWTDVEFFNNQKLPDVRLRNLVSEQRTGRNTVSSEPESFPVSSPAGSIEDMATCSATCSAVPIPPGVLA